jgi:hypothetical protein
MQQGKSLDFEWAKMIRQHCQDGVPFVFTVDGGDRGNIRKRMVLLEVVRLLGQERLTENSKR